MLLEKNFCDVKQKDYMTMHGRLYKRNFYDLIFILSLKITAFKVETFETYIYVYIIYLLSEITMWLIIPNLS